MDRALLALAALLINAVFAGPRRLYEAVGLLRLSQTPAALLRGLERKLNRDRRSQTEREIRGTLVALVLVTVSALLGWVMEILFTHDLRFAVLLTLAALLPVRPAWDIASQIRDALQGNNVQKARQALAGTIWRHHALLDEYGVARAAVEILAMNFSQKIIAPLLGYMLLGLPGLFVCRIMTLMAETIVPAAQSEDYFAKTTRYLHMLIQLIPSRVAAIAWLAASGFYNSRNPGRAARRICAGLFVAPPQELALLAAAETLGLALGGPTSAYAPRGWQGEGAARIGSGDIKRAMYAYALLLLFVFLMLGFRL